MSQKKTNSLSQRERLLLPLAVAIIVGVLYGALRIRPGLGQIEKLQQDLSKAVKSRESLSWPSTKGSSADALRRELSQLEKTHEETSTALASAEAGLAEYGASPELQRLRILISELAHRNDIKVLKNVPVASANHESESASLPLRLADAPEVPRQSDAPIIHEYFQLMYARPLQHLELSATFASLRNFIGSLNELDYRVSVVSFHLKMEEETDQLALPQLRSELVLAL